MVAAFLAACSGGRRGRTTEDPGGSHGQLAAEDRFVPSYGKPELQKALIAERAAEATGERIVAELEAKSGDVRDQLRVAVADLAVRRRFIAMLEACEASGASCPPRLDDPSWTFDPDPDTVVAPPLTSALRFDVESWRTIGTELHGRACACRTISCVDSLGVAIDQLEKRPIADVQGDEAASGSITRARECLFRLRGRALLRSSTSVQDLAE